MWEWDIRVLDIQDGIEGDDAPVCVGGRGASAPEFRGGPTVYRLMLKRREETRCPIPYGRRAGIQLLAEACPDQPADRWDLLRAFGKGFHLCNRIGSTLQEANARLSQLAQGRRLWSGIPSFPKYSPPPRR
jgi:hypothetical protein